MTVKEELHTAVEELSDDEAAEILELIRRRRALPAFLRDAPYDDEEETDEERTAVAEGTKPTALAVSSPTRTFCGASARDLGRHLDRSRYPRPRAPRQPDQQSHRQCRRPLCTRGGRQRDLSPGL